MTKKQRRLKVLSLYDQSDVLSMSHWRYKRQVKRYLWNSFRDDAWRDETTRAILPHRHAMTGQIVTREACVVAGVVEAEWIAKRAGLSVDVKKADGKLAKSGDVIMELHGNGRTLLEVERTIVTAMQRLSGIATTTAEWVKKTGMNTHVSATRKTLWGLLDKRAVMLGGGLTHRLNLQSGVMVKDNHWLALERSGYTLHDIEYTGSQPRWIEVDTLKQLKEVAEAKLPYDVILLDNFKPAQISSAMKWLKSKRLASQYILEASGGITPQTASRYAKTGVDVISSSQLTVGATAVDLSLDIL